MAAILNYQKVYYLHSILVQISIYSRKQYTTQHLGVNMVMWDDFYPLRAIRIGGHLGGHFEKKPLRVGW